MNTLEKSYARVICYFIILFFFLSFEYFITILDALLFRFGDNVSCFLDGPFDPSAVTQEIAIFVTIVVSLEGSTGAHM